MVKVYTFGAVINLETFVLVGELCIPRAEILYQDNALELINRRGRRILEIFQMFALPNSDLIKFAAGHPPLLMCPHFALLTS